MAFLEIEKQNIFYKAYHKSLTSMTAFLSLSSKKCMF